MIGTDFITFVNTLSDFEVLYVVASLAIAILIWVECSWVLRNKGKLPKSNVFAVISLMTSSWLVVSGLALFFLDFRGLMMSVPVVYGIYSLMGWIYGARLISVADIDDPMDLVLPEQYLNFCRSFAFVFAILCLLVLVRPYLAIWTT